jgi:16S rRNA (cytidine1402-2'-O)-methyltransferase
MSANPTVHAASPSSRGTLYLVPTPLDLGCTPADERPADLTHTLPDGTLRQAARLTHWITENARSARAFLKRLAQVHPLPCPLQSLHIVELPRALHKHGDHSPTRDVDAAARHWLQPALDGHDVGLLSEAGMPAIADPGSSVVRAAHASGVPVVPLVGPVSLALALAASGLNGQHFSFAGYVPADAAGRRRRIQALEQQALRPGTRLAVCCGLTLPGQGVRSGLVATWHRHGWAASLPLDLPSVFLIGA